MLSSFYDEIIYGKNYLSLSYALARKRKNKEILLIDDENTSIGSNWCDHLGLVEVKFLQKLGEEFGIESLKNIFDFLSPYTLALSLDENIIELGPSPIDHINELARKLPECFSEDFIHKISGLDRKFMDELVEHQLSEIALDFYQNDKKKYDFNFKSTELTQLAENFYKAMNERDSLKTKELYLSMQMLFQTHFSNKVNAFEAKYLFTRLLSPSFKVQTKELCEALVFEFREHGGHLKKTSVKEWEFYENELQALLLNSYEGLIKTNEVKIFTALNHSFPFDINEKKTKYYSLKLKGKMDHSFIKFYKNQRIVFLSENSLGTDFPYAEVTFYEGNYLEGLFTYADYPGSKASFHLKRAQESIFERLEKILPGLSKEEWFHNMELSEAQDLWTEETRESKTTSKNTDEITGQKGLVLNDSLDKIKFIEYWGPLHTKTLGILGHLVEIKKAISF